ncbi:hypothetical protein, partial [Candidatus Ichthyocystis sparus]|uniref:hypothetical protein n=1 Tax=Candidatus Ichthyocystis sparus TaxID=1561004 RepID=UPI0011469725
MISYRSSSFYEPEQQDKNTSINTSSTEENAEPHSEKVELYETNLQLQSASTNLPPQQTYVEPHHRYDPLLPPINTGAEQDIVTSLLHPDYEYDVYQYDQYYSEQPCTNTATHNSNNYNPGHVTNNQSELSYACSNNVTQQYNTPSTTIETGYASDLSYDVRSCQLAQSYAYDDNAAQQYSNIPSITTVETGYASALPYDVRSCQLAQSYAYNDNAAQQYSNIPPMTTVETGYANDLPYDLLSSQLAQSYSYNDNATQQYSNIPSITTIETGYASDLPYDLLSSQLAQSYSCNDKVTQQNEDISSMMNSTGEQNRDFSYDVYSLHQPYANSLHKQKITYKDKEQYSEFNQKTNKKSALDISKTNMVENTCLHSENSTFEKDPREDKTKICDKVLNYVGTYPISISVIFSSMIKDRSIELISISVLENINLLSQSNADYFLRKNMLSDSLEKIEYIMDSKTNCLFKLDKLLENFKLTTDIEINNLSELIFPKNTIIEAQKNLESEIPSIAMEIKSIIANITNNNDIAEKASSSILSVINKSKNELFSALTKNYFCESIIMSPFAGDDSIKIPLATFNRIINFRDKIYYELNNVEQKCLKSINMLCRINDFYSIEKLSPEIAINFRKCLDVFSQFINNELEENYIFIL